ncbi:MAG: PaaI family thioesterase [Halanaeroarchaeum sp.]
MNDVYDSEDARAFLQRYIDQHGYLSFLDLQVESLKPGEMIMRVPYHEKLANRGQGNGNVHGGIAASLIDTAGGLSVHASLDDPIESGVATIDLNVSYLRPARGDLLATAEVVRIGSTVGVATVDVESTLPGGEEGTVAVGRGSFRIFRPDDS